MTRRSYGTGSLTVRRDGNGRETWYGRWRVGDRKLNRRIGPKRQDGSREGLTRSQAEQEFRRLMESETAAQPLRAVRMTLGEAGKRHIDQREAAGLDFTTIADYRSYLRVQFEPFFTKPLDEIRPADVEAFIVQKRREGKAPKSIINWLGLLHGIFAFAEKKGWVQENPCRGVEGPRREKDTRIKFLTLDELEALLAAKPERPSLLWETDRVLYLTAAMTGLRQGELLALPWRDIDWLASKIRVHDNWVRGQRKAPKSHRSRSVPLADRVARELEAHSQRSNYSSDDDLVFCHPKSGEPFNGWAISHRFKDAVERAGVTPVTFHELRHTFGTQMAAANVPAVKIQEWLGHSDSRTTAIYTHFAPSRHEADWIEQAFSSVHSSVQSEGNSGEVRAPQNA